MTIIFKAKTSEAYTLKTLSELLQSNLKTACFEIDSSGIKMCMGDAHGHIMIQLHLEKDSFVPYVFRAKEKIYFGINLSHFHKMLRSVKKKDIMSLYIDDENPYDLGICVTPKEKTRTSTSFVKIQKIQAVNIQLPTNYGIPSIIPSSDFQKMCKDMSHIDKTIQVCAEGYSIRFTCGSEGVMKRVVDFGEKVDSDTEDVQESKSEIYDQSFDTDQLRRITKISGLGTKMKVYAKKGLPLKFCCNVGELGTISLYIKSKQQLEDEVQHTGKSYSDSGENSDSESSSDED